MKFIWKYMKKHPRLILLDIIGGSAFVVLNIALPTILARIIDDVIVGGRHHELNHWALVILVVIVAGTLGRILLTYASSKIPNLMVRDMRKELYRKIQDFSHQEYDEIGVSSLVTRMTNDAFVLLQFAQQALGLGIVAPMMMLASAVMVFKTSTSLAWVFFAAMPLLVLIIYYLVKRTEPLSRQQQSTLDKINQYARENLSGMRVIRAFTREEYQEEKFEDANQEYQKISKNLFYLMGATTPGFLHILIWVIVAIFAFSFKPLASGSLQIGNLVAFVEYAFHGLFSLQLFANLFMLYPRAAVSAQRLQEIQDIPISITTNEDGITETTEQGRLEFKNVTFAYPGETETPVLEDISFKANPGETIAFIGSTGSGKSTLVQLIPRFYDVTEGQVLVDGVDVRDFQLKALRNKIGFIPQSALLFTGTIEDNIRYGKVDATTQEMDRAVDVAQAQEFVKRYEEGYQAVLAEAGTNLSGGQKQRLAIARALVKEPEFFIFDDSFSALDYQTDAILRARLEEVAGDATTLIVAQRVTSIMDADKIIVLDKGRVAGIGTHDELLANNELYQAIAYSQLSKDNFQEGGE